MHMKGYMLQLFAQRGQMWDQEVVDAVTAEYGVSGAYWRGSIRLTLIDLYSSCLLDEVDAKVDDSGGAERLTIKYKLTEFGRERMQESGLMGAIS